MFCPSCRSEYREGFTRCEDCDVALVAELPPADAGHQDPEYDLETVLATGDPALLAFAESLLEGAGIPYYAKREGVQDLFGAGRLGTGFSLVAGPVELQVTGDRRQETEELLAQAIEPPEIPLSDAMSAREASEGEEPDVEG